MNFACSEVLSGHLREEILRLCTFVPICAGSTVLRQGEVPGIWFGVSSGLLELSFTRSDGLRMMADLLSAGEWFGCSQLLAARPSPFEVSAVGPARLLVMRRESLRQLLAEHTQMQEWLRLLSMRHGEQVLSYMAMYASSSTEDRLEQLLARHGDHLSAICANQSVLARMVGASRQRVNAALATLERRGVLQPSPRRAHSDRRSHHDCFPHAND